jgi:hypothetical protein
MNALDNIQKLPEFKGLKINSFFHVPARFFGKDCTQLYKIIGFDPIENRVYANKRNKRTLKLEGNTIICVGFKYEDVIKYLK